METTKSGDVERLEPLRLWGLEDPTARHTYEGLVAVSTLVARGDVTDSERRAACEALSAAIYDLDRRFWYAKQRETQRMFQRVTARLELDRLDEYADRAGEDRQPKRAEVGLVDGSTVSIEQDSVDGVVWLRVRDKKGQGAFERIIHSSQADTFIDEIQKRPDHPGSNFAWAVRLASRI